MLKTKLRLTAKAAAPDIARIDEFMEKAMVEAKADVKNKGKKIKPSSPPYQIDEETGEVTLSFKVAAGGESRDEKNDDGTPKIWQRKIALFDAAGKPFDRSIIIGAGSKIKVSYIGKTFYTALAGAGVQLRPQAVQVLELVEYAGPGASTYGFSAEAAADAEEEEEEGEESAEEETLAEAGEGSDF